MTEPCGQPIRCNIKVNEFLFRRVDLEDVVMAHLQAAERATALGFRRYIISATTPFSPDDVHRLRTDAPGVIRALVPDYELQYARRGWRMFPGVDRVYINERARSELGWKPKYDFSYLVSRLRDSGDLRSPLARLVGSKGYHAGRFADKSYPVI